MYTTTLEIADNAKSAIAQLMDAAGSESAFAQGDDGVATSLSTVAMLRANASYFASAFNSAADVIESRSAVLSAGLQESAIARVIALLNNGAMSLDDLAAKVNPAMLVRQPTPPVKSPTFVDAGDGKEQVVSPALDAASNKPAADPKDAAPAPAPAKVEAAPCAPSAPTEAPAIDAIVPTQKLTAPYKNKVQFFDPVSGNGWSGYGPMPVWLKELCVNGKTKADFRVAKADAAPAVRANKADVGVVAEAPAADTTATTATTAPAADCFDIGAPMAAALAGEDFGLTAANEGEGDFDIDAVKQGASEAAAEVASFDASPDEQPNAMKAAGGDLDEFTTSFMTMAPHFAARSMSC
jgi:hypothetical protein